MKNNKGFTLIELLAVIVILSGVALVAVASVSSSLENRDKKECEEQVSLAKNAAKVYFSLHDGETSVSVEKLKTDGYFNGNQKVDRLVNSIGDITINRSSGEINIGNPCSN